MNPYANTSHGKAEHQSAAAGREVRNIREAKLAVSKTKAKATPLSSRRTMPVSDVLASFMHALILHACGKAQAARGSPDEIAAMN
eukprot:CAMPEP_0183444442 /NCGR_PEP_ID=MMETSP0370-20130417/95051_1 /TAXON_ID=268820 /ORGANISM="Peridinium aciculiferum, Strain PAER-2" /LENGTH=84 /DNA_ID=CAMNT_0025634795 /DNA_START=14 /DNA_END=266 /DNA_ORIENTATION=+